MQRFYPHIAAGAGVLILLLILWGPTDGEESARDSIVWQEDWEVIEYYAEPGDRYPALRLIREPGLVADEFFVEFPAKSKAATSAGLSSIRPPFAASADVSRAASVVGRVSPEAKPAFK